MQRESMQGHDVPQPVPPPPQMVPPPAVNQHGMGIMTNVPPPSHGSLPPPPLQSSWLYQGQDQVAFVPPQGQVQVREWTTNMVYKINCAKKRNLMERTKHRKDILEILNLGTMIWIGTLKF